MIYIYNYEYIPLRTPEKYIKIPYVIILRYFAMVVTFFAHRSLRAQPSEHCHSPSPAPRQLTEDLIGILMES